ncbi:hypothetical protein A2V56_04225 [Candidatus Woesebacteria bacterium RBG_19FT_COMBO_42_9]|uniref:PEGA domain-containing protein n=1 Tax=Candidatus Woesebacteria bacterium RBG_16_42_24 TaxID=1802485 RepID=A0A1F7XJK7_9BACT|nr:MAG: hypothetical protein A2V97_01140 [Candidatus Woesebacteria bacterium RBG_16_42_24]OGM17826.1 MAG: hypothetical protein A2V56_04225 [Candidatus Woesebacteria bacterium RBG_19FT_COMBO_42_9]OGM68102.1 MAG: hypothetical protein A2985_03465 [Candidatus Woesebacteria bacterium RIFCSPLOWO2_01_FULL_43_11]
MTKVRVAVFLITLIVVGVLGLFVSLYARGYRFDIKTFKFSPNGLLVVESDPSGAQVFVNGELVNATDTTISLSPGTYDIEFRKEGYITWGKRLEIQKEIVTEAIAHLFKSVPSLTPVSFSGSIFPVASSDFGRIAYSVAVANGNDSGGLWVIDTLNLPLGFAREPRQITDGDLRGATWTFSPDGREIMLTTLTGVFVLDAGTFTPQRERVNVATKKEELLAEWQKKADLKLAAQVKSLHPEIADILTRKTKYLTFSPDETKILYQASSEAIIPSGVVKELPGASTQKQERDIKEGRTYVYDIKEDRNFLISEEETQIGNWNRVTNSEIVETGNSIPKLTWFSTSGHLVLAQEGKVTIMDYDGTNRQVVYSGSYITPNAFPILSTDRIIILTNLGATDTLPNLYAVTIK